jgi:hypothetical protein
MRLTILAGLIVGVSLAFQSAHAVHARVIVGHAPVAVRTIVSAPWYVAMNAGRSVDVHGILAKRIQSNLGMA